jgi:hypothetical protein
MDKQQLTTGSRDGYQWLVSTDNQTDLFEICPELVVGKYIAMTSFDSGPFLLDENEQSAGWISISDIAYSPPITSIDMLARDWYDEWYIFRTPANLGEVVNLYFQNAFQEPEKGKLQVFVNFGGFALNAPAYESMVNFFWKQLALIRPESYLAVGDFLNFVTSDENLFTHVRHALS